jgi:protease I
LVDGDVPATIGTISAARACTAVEAAPLFQFTQTRKYSDLVNNPPARQNAGMAKIAILVEKVYEDLELQYPRLRLKEAGHTVEIIGPKAGEIYPGKHGYPQKSDKSASDVKAADYNLIVIPGGSSPDHMRRDGGMVKLVRDAAARGIPLAAICHGPWMLCSTNILKGRRATSFFAIAHDVVNAGAKWVDEECVVDGQIITSRCPDDLPSFSNAILQLLAEGKPQGVRGRPIAPSWLIETIPAASRG